MRAVDSSGHFDLAVVGAGIVGLATALAAARRGLRVAVIDRDARANGASVRNFGFVCVTGQERGVTWPRARRSREVWREVAGAAGIGVVHDGMWMVVRRPEARAVIEEFMRGDMAQGCRLLEPAEAQRRFPQLAARGLAAVLESTTELRVDSRTAIPLLALWLASAHRVHFMRSTVVTGVEPPWLATSAGRLRAERVVVCPGDDYTGLYADRLARQALTRCRLQMLRLADPGFRIPAALMSDLGLARYAGYAQLAASATLRRRLAAEQPQHLEHGVHLIVVQNADGSLVVGDSHHYSMTPEPFARADIDALILGEFRAAFGIDPPAVLERWIGSYAAAADRTVLIDAPEPAVRIAIVTSGTGASTAFAIGEELVASLFDSGTMPAPTAPVV